MARGTLPKWIGTALSGLVFAFAVAALLFGLSQAFGCSNHTRSIAAAAQKSGQDAGEIIGNAQAARNELASPPEEVPTTPSVLSWLGRINSYLIAIEKKASGIQSQSAAIGKDVTHVEDKVPWWASLIKLLAALGAIALIVYVGIATGVFGIIRAWLMAMGWFIPKAKVSSAKLDLEALDNPAKLTEAVASRRTSDPAYDAAFRKAKKDSEEQE